MPRIVIVIPYSVMQRRVIWQKMHHQCTVYIPKPKLCGLSSRANYTDSLRPRRQKAHSSMTCNSSLVLFYLRALSLSELEKLGKCRAVDLFEPSDPIYP
jgi:hypothetical protein